MKKTYHYASVSKALDELKKKGFTYDFNIHDEEIISDPNQHEIVHVYRYEGNSNPDDEAVVFGIRSESGKQGVFVTGFSANSVSEAAQLLIQLSIAERNK